MVVKKAIIGWSIKHSFFLDSASFYWIDFGVMIAWGFCFIDILAGCRQLKVHWIVLFLRRGFRSWIKIIELWLVFVWGFFLPLWQPRQHFIPILSPNSLIFSCPHPCRYLCFIYASIEIIIISLDWLSILITSFKGWYFLVEFLVGSFNRILKRNINPCIKSFYRSGRFPSNYFFKMFLRFQLFDIIVLPTPFVYTMHLKMLLDLSSCMIHW